MSGVFFGISNRLTTAVFSLLSALLVGNFFLCRIFGETENVNVLNHVLICLSVKCSEKNTFLKLSLMSFLIAMCFFFFKQGFLGIVDSLMYLKYCCLKSDHDKKSLDIFPVSLVLFSSFSSTCCNPRIPGI